MSVESVVIAIDGESKCGKTTIINTIAEEAVYQAGIIPALVNDQIDDWRLDDDGKSGLWTVQEALGFSNITPISGGDAYRAATLYLALLELEGQVKAGFDTSDYEPIRQLLETEGIGETLQHDPNIGAQVTRVATMAGAQALCSTVSCKQIMEAYHRDDGGNLVIIDSRDPIGTLERHNLIGNCRGQIVPGAILPVYVDTPTEVAAKRLGGNFDDKLKEVASRRSMDASREQYPVTWPTELMENFNDWLQQFLTPERDYQTAVPYLLYNGEGVSLGNIQNRAGRIASAAQDIGYGLALSA